MMLALLAASLIVAALTLQGCEEGEKFMKLTFSLLLAAWTGMLLCMLVVYVTFVRNERSHRETDEPPRPLVDLCRDLCPLISLGMFLSAPCWLLWLFIMLFAAWTPSFCDPECGPTTECGRDWLGFRKCICPSGTSGEPDSHFDLLYTDNKDESCWRCPENMRIARIDSDLGNCVCDKESVPWSHSDGLTTFTQRRRTILSVEHRRRRRDYESEWMFSSSSRVVQIQRRRYVDKDYFEVLQNLSECVRCTVGVITQLPDGRRECICPQGSVWRLDECMPCPNGTTTREAGSNVCGCPTGHVFAANGSCSPCPVGTTTKWPASDVCNVGISVGMHWALAAFLSILCALCPIIVVRWLRFSWPMSFDVAVSSIDFGSDLFWVLTDPFYDEAAIVFGFVFLFGTSLVFILAFYVRGLPGVIRSWWSMHGSDQAESVINQLCLPIGLPFIVGDAMFQALRGFLEFDLMGCIKQTKPVGMLQEGRERLATRGIFQVYETIDGELLYVLANIAVTILLILVLVFGWAVCACAISMSLLLWGAIRFATLCCVALLMVGMFVVGLIVVVVGLIGILAYIAAKGAVSFIVILGLICLGIVLNMTRLLAARPVSHWYEALWIKAPQDNSPSKPLARGETLEHPQFNLSEPLKP